MEGSWKLVGITGPFVDRGVSGASGEEEISGKRQAMARLLGSRGIMLK